MEQKVKQTNKLEVDLYYLNAPIILKVNAIENSTKVMENEMIDGAKAPIHPQSIFPVNFRNTKIKVSPCNRKFIVFIFG
jgi:hypothetical protein